MVEAGKEARADAQRFNEISMMEILWCWHKGIESEALAWAGVGSHNLTVKIKVKFLHRVFLMLILSPNTVSLW